MNYLNYYSVESYLFGTVHVRFHDQGWLSAFDFFTIINWKARRANSKIAKRLLRHAAPGETTLDAVVKILTRDLYDARSARDRLEILMDEWGFLLPMASAILTVLWPDEFTVYDRRACAEVGGFHRLGGRSRCERVWDEYLAFRAAVRREAPAGLSLRDADRYLFGRSRWKDLGSRIEQGFSKAPRTHDGSMDGSDPCE